MRLQGKEGIVEVGITLRLGSVWVERGWGRRLPERHCIYHGPYGKRLERLGIPLKIQQLADRKSAKGVTWSMDGPIRRLRPP